MRPFDPRIRTQLAPARRPLLGVVAAGVGGSLLLIVQAFAVTGLVVAVVDGRALAPWLGAVAAVFVLRAALGWGSDLAAARAAATVGTALRRRVVGTVLRRHGAGGAPASASGELAVLATRGVSAAEPYLTRYVPAVVLAAILPPLTLVVIATQDLLSALIVALTLPLVPVFGALVGLATRDRAAEQWREMAALSGHFVDVMKGLPTLVAFRRARAQSSRIGAFTDRYRRASLATLRLAFASSAVLELVATLSVALVAVVVGVRLAEGDLPLSTALVVLLLAPEAYWPLRRMGAEFHAAAEGVATFEAVAALGSDEPGDEEGRTEASYDEVAAADAALVLDDVTVTHPGRTLPALAGVTAVVPARGVTVLTGPSGCGKSTLLAAIAGLVPLTGGQVTVAGWPVGGEAWRSQVAWLPQRPVFVSGSIADNLRVATPAADDARLWDALRRVALEERVRTLPHGLDEPVGEDGTTLSAGERARLALARVLVDDRPWVLLDEPTAHLDEVTEVIIADTIAELGRTGGVLVVAHRPALVALADTVLTLPAPAAPAVVAPAPVAARPRPARARPAEPEPDEAAAPSSRRSLALSTLLGGLASASGVALTATAGWLIVQASTQPPVLTLLVAIVGVRLFGLARPALRYAERLRSHDVALRMLAERRVQVYDAVVPLTPGRLGRRRGDVLTSIVDDVDSVVDRELRVRLPLRGFVLVALLAAAVSALLLPAAGVLVLGTCLLSAALGTGLARAGAGRAEHRAVERRAELSATVLEVLSLAPELVMWQAGGRAAARVAAASRRLAACALDGARWLGGARAAVLLVHGLGVVAMAALVAPAVSDGTLSGPRAALLVLVPLALGEVAAGLPDAGALSARTDAAAGRLHALERRAPAVRDTVPGPAPRTSEIELSHVTAGWDRGQRALRDLSLRIPAGTRVGLVGESGSGKSTVAALLLRFLDPVRGAVLLGGRDLYRVALDDVRARVGLVDDDPHVFASTLVENVRLARPDASDPEVEAALRRARLGDWLDTLPDGLDTWLGEGHAAVSGGERARLAVARSLLAGQPVLVLDEPTAHLDHATAEELAREVLLAPDGRTIVWITHDPVGLELVDRVVELAAPADLVPLVRR